MPATLILILIACLTSVGFICEGWLYARRLRRIPIRIHVNGTRGKSSVTRLICAGLNAGGIRTCAKTTGTQPRMILSDGSELPIFRPGRANVIEQKRVVRAAVNHAAEALVIECMALQPMLQSVCELQLVRSTHGVITNARADHLDVMGPTRLDVARALAGTTPSGGEMYTAEQSEDSLDVLRSAADDRGTRFEAISEFERHRVKAEMLAGFSYLEHAENVALALRVCESLGVSRESAIGGMWAATPDPGAMRVSRFSAHRNGSYFVNALAANDPESTTQIWAATCEQYPHVSQRVAVMNCRHDRAERSQSMARACADWPMLDHVFVIGTGTEVFTRTLASSGLPADRISRITHAETEAIISAIQQRAWEETLIIGVGNVAGPGMAIADYFRQLESEVASQTKEPFSGHSTSGRDSKQHNLRKVA